MGMKSDKYGELPYLNNPTQPLHTSDATTTHAREGAVGESTLHLQVNRAKTNDAGEDAEPINISFAPQHGFIAVFDGLGGSGSEIYRDRDGHERTGAYIASRIVRNSVHTYCTQHRIPQEINANVLNPLKESIQQTVNQRAATQPHSMSRILSSMRRTLPTTMAGVFHAPTQSDNVYHCDVVWAGDSRIFCLTPDAGLQQLTRDHVKGSNHDTLHDFVQDSPISNCVQANAEFFVEHRRFVIHGPLMLIAATDGCYSALPSPAHFERIVLAQLMQSTNSDDWAQRIHDTVGAIAQDDLSMSIVGLGIPDFVTLQQLFHSRLNELEHVMCEHRMLASQTTNQSAIMQLLEVLQPIDFQQRLATFWQNYYYTTYTARLKEYTHGR